MLALTSDVSDLQDILQVRRVAQEHCIPLSSGDWGESSRGILLADMRRYHGGYGYYIPDLSMKSNHRYYL